MTEFIVQVKGLFNRVFYVEIPLPTSPVLTTDITRAKRFTDYDKAQKIARKYIFTGEVLEVVEEDDESEEPA